MRVALAQLNPVVGDVAGNLALLQRTLEQVAAERPDLVVFPELFLTGYPPLDLLERSWFVDRAEQALVRVGEISRSCPDAGILVGAPTRARDRTGKPLHNSAVLFVAGREVIRRHKMLLPVYDVFDESRYFGPGTETGLAKLGSETLGISVCEDAWNGTGLGTQSELSDNSVVSRARYGRNPVAELAKAGATILVTISASPFWAGKEELRYRLISGHAARHGLPYAFVNQVGANDELVFDGRSMVFDAHGEPILVMQPFAEQVAVVDTGGAGSKGGFVPQERVESVYRALVLGVRDYARKCGFRQAVLGLSGGIDSAVACCLAVEALGPDNVLGVTMPSEYSSAGSVEDSRRLAQNLGIRLAEIPISDLHQGYLGALADQFRGRPADEAEENIQARIRGNLLMALSNKFGYLVVATGNKSELAVGYCTLYGDMSGGLAVLADVPKTMVYELARHTNRTRELIPVATIEKPPSAELRPDQTDQDSLPPYEILDEILARYVEDGQSVEQIAAAGLERQTVEQVVGLVRKNEYKRRQAAVGIKVTSKAFGTGRRMPIAAKY